MNCEAVDPAFPRVVGSKYRSDQATAVQSAKVRAAIQTQLMGDGASAVTAPHPRIEAASLEESYQFVVIREPQAADAKRHLIARRRPSGGGGARKGRGHLSGGGSAGTRASRGRRGTSPQR